MLQILIMILGKKLIILDLCVILFLEKKNNCLSIILYSIARTDIDRYIYNSDTQSQKVVIIMKRCNIYGIIQCSIM